MKGIGGRVLGIGGRVLGIGGRVVELGARDLDRSGGDQGWETFFRTSPNDFHLRPRPQPQVLRLVLQPRIANHIVDTTLEIIGQLGQSHQVCACVYRPAGST